jgi:hypothetical protein
VKKQVLYTTDLRDDTKTLGLALSGGGYRSALFSLGVLHYLVRSGKNHRLHTITSVSGGSYTNAQAFLFPDNLCKVREGKFVEHFRSYAGGFVDKSPWTRPTVLGLIILIAAALLVAVIGIPPHGWYWRVIAAVVSLVAIPRFGKVLARAIWKRLFKNAHRKARLAPPTDPAEPTRMVDTTKGGLQLSRTKQAVDAIRPRDTVHHVFCATDLHYLRFMYFSNRLVYNRRLRHAQPSDFTLKRAIDASAAIPPIFAPVVVDTRPFKMRPPDAPRKLLTVDGGVHDTLATEWYRVAPSIPPRPTAPASDHERVVDVPDVVLVVDGSAPIRPKDHVPYTTFWIARKRMPVLWWVMSHVRSAFAAFSNWDRRNFRRLRRTRRTPVAPDAGGRREESVPPSAGEGRVHDDQPGLRDLFRDIPRGQHQPDSMAGRIARSMFAFLLSSVRLLWSAIWRSDSLGRVGFGGSGRPDESTDVGRRSRASLVAVTIQEFPLQLGDAAHMRTLRRDHVDWGDVVRKNAEVPTWPKKLSKDRAAKLIFHGYATAWTVFTDPAAIERGLKAKHDLPTIDWVRKRWFG